MFCGRNNSQSAEENICSEFSMGEETYGIATSVFGVCARRQNAHVFRVNSPLIAGNIRKDFHGSAKGKTFGLNYQLGAAIQQMGCGSTDVATLVAFLDLPTSWSTISSHMKQCESVMGPVQIAMADESEKYALAEELAFV